MEAIVGKPFEPIATAPKDRRILLRWPDGHCHIGRFRGLIHDNPKLMAGEMVQPMPTPIWHYETDEGYPENTYEQQSHPTEWMDVDGSKL